MKKSLAVGLVLSSLSWSAFARFDASCEASGGTYDVFTRECVKAGRDMVRAWSQSADRNKNSLSFVLRGLEGCDGRGAAHQEPDVSSVQSLEVKFSDGMTKYIIPAQTSCERENSKFALSGGTCKIGFYEYFPKRGKVFFTEREISFDGEGSGLSWKDALGSSHRVTSISESSITKALPRDESPGFVDRDGPACKLAREINANQVSERSLPSGKAGSRQDGVQ